MNENFRELIDLLEIELFGNTIDEYKVNCEIDNLEYFQVEVLKWE